MELHQFPRPPKDNGRGIHWSASLYHPQGADLDRWIGELQEMNIRWVKVLDDGGGSSEEACRRLSEAGIVPVVRLYRSEPNPGTITGRETEAVKRLAAVGARYFETNNEPDTRYEWRDGRLPGNWLEVVIDQFIHDADAVLGAGGLPALPAMGVPSENPFRILERKGRADLLEKGAWVAIHNYTLNHPLDYPLDDVNQKGKPLTPDEYLRHGSWAWDGQPMELINRWRDEDKNPGATLRDDSVCFRAFELWDDLVREVVGHSIPIITTEGGIVIGDRQDRRYPRNTPQAHQERTVAMADYMQRQAPEYYFANCAWLLAEAEMGHSDAGRYTSWESQAWFTWWFSESQWQFKGKIPTVDAVMRMPSVERSGPRKNSMVLGEVEGAKEGLEITLKTVGGQMVAQTTTDSRGNFRFANLAAGTYNIDAERMGTVIWRLKLDGGNTKVVSFRWEEQSPTVGEIRGTVVIEGTGARAGARVSLEGRDVLLESTTGDQGQFRFGNLVPGTYKLGTQGAAKREVKVRPGDSIQVDLIIPSSARMRYALTKSRLLPREEVGGRHIFYGRVLDAAGEALNGIRVQMSWTNGEPPFPTTVTGRDPGKPPGSFEFSHTPGEYQLQVVQGDWESDIAEDLRTDSVEGQDYGLISYEVEFQLRPAVAEGAVVRGTISGGHAGLRIILRSASWEGKTSIDDADAYEFIDVPPGTYSLIVEGVGTIRKDMVLKGSDVHVIDFPMKGGIRGKVIGGDVGLQVALLSQDWDWQRETSLDATGFYRFFGLPAGTYTLRVSPVEVDDIVLDGLQVMSLEDVNLGAPSPTQKVIYHYLLFAPHHPKVASHFRSAQDYIMAFHPTVGFLPEEAQKSQYVTVVGDEKGITAEQEEELRQAGCQVERIAGDRFELAQRFAALVRRKARFQTLEEAR